MIAILSFLVQRWKLLVLLVVVSMVVAIALFAGPLIEALKADPMTALRPIPRQRLTDCDGKHYLDWPEYGALSATDPDSLPENLINAVVAREDKRFMTHGGWDFRGFCRALIRTCACLGRKHQGGSTITMQLVDITYNYPESGRLAKLRSKVFEVVVAHRIENRASKLTGNKKDAKLLILSRYLDRAPFGGNLTGIQQAVHHFHGKEVSNLGLGECAYLAGLIRAPSRNSVYVNEDNARAARDAVLSNMVKLGMISTTQAESDGKFYASKSPHSKVRRGDGFTSGSVKSEISRLIAEDKLPANTLDQPDLSIRLTCNVKLQTEVSKILERHLQKIGTQTQEKRMVPRLNGSVVVLRNSDSAVLCCVGGRSFDLLQVNLATSFPGRPLASAIKPFSYAAAFEADPKLTITSKLSNAPVAPSSLPNFRGNFAPKECLAESEWPLWIGLKQSSNRMAVAIGAKAGNYHWSRLMKELHLCPANHALDPSIFLGSGNTRPIDVAAAYACLANGGTYSEPRMVDSITIADQLVYQRTPVPRRILARHSCVETTKGLREVLRSGTAAGQGGAEIAARIPLAGKTGTASSGTDLWFCGYGSDVTVVVWIGYPESLKPVQKDASGASLAFPVWKNVIEELVRRGYPFKPLPSLTSAQRGDGLARSKR